MDIYNSLTILPLKAVSMIDCKSRLWVSQEMVEFRESDEKNEEGDLAIPAMAVPSASAIIIAVDFATT